MKGSKKMKQIPINCNFDPHNEHNGCKYQHVCLLNPSPSRYKTEYAKYEKKVKREDFIKYLHERHPDLVSGNDKVTRIVTDLFPGDFSGKLVLSRMEYLY